LINDGNREEGKCFNDTPGMLGITEEILVIFRLSGVHVDVTTTFALFKNRTKGIYIIGLTFNS
jgi:hypothetical protein